MQGAVGCYGKSRLAQHRTPGSELCLADSEGVFLFPVVDFDLPAVKVCLQQFGRVLDFLRLSEAWFKKTPLSHPFPTGGALTATITSIWTGIDWTFENRANLSAAQAAMFYGRNNVPADFTSVVSGPSGSQVWSSGSLKAGFTSQLDGIPGQASGSLLCNGLGASLAIGAGVANGTIANNVPGALQFASGGVVPGHGSGVVEKPVATFGTPGAHGTFTFYQPIYPKPPNRPK